MARSAWLVMAALALAGTGCDNGSPKPVATSPAATSGAPSAAVAATLRAEVTGGTGAVDVVSGILRNRLGAVGATPVNVATSGTTLSFALPRRLTSGELAGLGRAGVLAFRPVAEQVAPDEGATGDCRDPRVRQRIAAASGGTGSLDAAVVLCDADGTGKYVVGPATLTGHDVKTASAQREEVTQEWTVALEFTSARQWADVTERLAGESLAIVLDGEVQSAPTIQERITSGSAQVSGDFTEEEARLLAATLRFGALPATVTLTQS